MDNLFLHPTESQLGIGENGSTGSWLNVIVRKELVEINMLLPDLLSSDCLLTDIGEYLCRATAVLARLAHRMANGDHIHTYTQLKINQMNAQTDLSELGNLDQMTSKHSILMFDVEQTPSRVPILTLDSNLAERLRVAEKDTTRAWRAASHASAGGGSLGNTFLKEPAPMLRRLDEQSSAATASTRVMPDMDGQQSMHAHGPSTEAIDPSGEGARAEISTDAVISTLLQEINHRGKGVHYCPCGPACKKGGVAADGSVVLFERNSAFKFVSRVLLSFQ